MATDPNREASIALYLSRLEEIGKLYDESVDQTERYPVVHDLPKLQQINPVCKALLEEPDMPLQFRALCNFYLAFGHSEIEDTLFYLESALGVLDDLQGSHGEELDCRNTLYCLIYQAMAIRDEAQRAAEASAPYDYDYYDGDEIWPREQFSEVQEGDETQQDEESQQDEEVQLNEEAQSGWGGQDGEDEEGARGDPEQEKEQEQQQQEEKNNTSRPGTPAMKGNNPESVGITSPATIESLESPFKSINLEQMERVAHDPEIAGMLDYVDRDETEFVSDRLERLKLVFGTTGGEDIAE